MPTDLFPPTEKVVTSTPTPSDDGNSSQRSGIGWAILGLVFSLFFSFWNLGYSSYHAEDEALHVSVIQQMIHNGHLVVPHDEKGPYFNKPPLKMWATIPVVSLLGETPFAFRFLDGLAGLVCGLLIFQIGRALFSSPPAGFFATAFFFTADIVLFDHGIRSAVQDSWLLLFSIAALWIGYRATFESTSPAARDQSLITVGACTGLSLMVKSAAGFLAPALLAVVWLLTGARRISLRGAVLALLCAVTPALLFGAIVFFRHPADLMTALNREVVARVTDGFQRQDQPFFYLTLIGRRDLAIDGAWLLFSMVLMGYSAWKGRFPHLVFLSVWALGPIVLFSAVKTRLEWYILPAIPAHALVAGWALDVVVKQSSRFILPRKALLLQLRSQPIRAVITVSALFFGATVFSTELSESVGSLVSPPHPVALDQTARSAVRGIGPQPIVVYPEIHTVVPALFERNHLRSLAGGRLKTASSQTELTELFGTGPGQERWALTLPEFAAHLIATGAVRAYRSFPPLISFPRQHQRRHWLVLLSADPIDDKSFQSVSVTNSLPPKGGILELPPSSFITQTLGMSVSITAEKPLPGPSELAVRVYRTRESAGAPVPCGADGTQLSCRITPELATQARPSILSIERRGVAEDDVMDSKDGLTVRVTIGNRTAREGSSPPSAPL